MRSGKELSLIRKHLFLFTNAQFALVFLVGWFDHKSPCTEHAE